MWDVLLATSACGGVLSDVVIRGGAESYMRQIAPSVVMLTQVSSFGTCRSPSDTSPAGPPMITVRRGSTYFSFCSFSSVMINSRISFGLARSFSSDLIRVIFSLYSS